MSRQAITHYFDHEGRDYMRECLTLALRACVESGLQKLVIFTGTGEGPHFAATELRPQPPFEEIELVAVTPPFGRPYRERPGDPDSPVVNAGIHPAVRDELEALGVGLVSAHLPFKEMWDGRERRSEWSRVAEAYGVFGGGFALCIQALLIACDAGFVQNGERVVVAAADTGFIARATRTETFLSPFEGMLIEHIICRPERYSISKPAHHAFQAHFGAEVHPTLPTVAERQAPQLRRKPGAKAGTPKKRKTARQK